MPKATVEGIIAINALLKKYEHSAAIPESERKAALSKAWPSMTADKTKPQKAYEIYLSNGLTQDQAINELYKDGYTSKRIAHAVKLDQKTVLRILHEQGCAKRVLGIYQNVLKPNLAKIQEMSAKGYSNTEIARELDLKYTSIQHNLEKHPDVVRAIHTGKAQWRKRKAELSKQTKEERINHD